MDGFLLLGLIGLGLFLLGPIAFFSTLGHGRRLREAEDALRTTAKRFDELNVAFREARASLDQIAAHLAGAESLSGQPEPSPAAVAQVAPAPSVAEAGVSPATVSEAVPEALAPSAAPADARVTEELAPESPSTPLEAPATTEPPAPADGPPPEALPAKTPAAPKQSWEEALGARWTVWVGGVAIALGALLLVRYSIEQGFFGPGARIALGLIIAVALVAAGEYLRRRESAPVVRGVPVAYVPGVLTAAGTVAAFGSIYAAHALYGFIGPGVAFLALGATGLAAMLAAALHGPALAGLGLLGALVAPLLVTSDRPEPWPVVVYVAVVVAAAHWLARARHWLWLALSAAAGGGLWSVVLFVGAQSLDFYHAALACLVIQTALAAAFLAVQPYREQRDEAAGFDAAASLALAGLTIVGLLFFHIHGSTEAADYYWIAAIAAVVAALVAAGVLAAPVAAAVALAGIVVLAATIYWPAFDTARSIDAPQILLDWAWPAPLGPRRFLTFCGVLSLVPAAFVGKRLLDGPRLTLIPAAFYAGAATLTPLGVLIVADLRLGAGQPSWPIAAGAAFLGALFAGSASRFQTVLAGREAPATRLGLGAFTASAIAALAAGLVFALDGAALTVALALAALATAFASTRLNVPVLRWCVAAIGVALAGRLAWNPRIVGAALSPTPIFNWLLFGYGAPALAFGFAARLMRRAGDDIPVRVADALAILFSAFLFFFEIRHLTNHGDPFARGSGLVEQALLAISSFGFAIVLIRLDASRANVVFRWASLGAGVLGMAFAAIGLLLACNPFIDGKPVEGGLFINALLLGYLIPAALAALLAVFGQGRRPLWYWGGAGALAMLLALFYGALELRLLFHGPAIGWDQGFTLSELGLDVAACLVLTLLSIFAGGGPRATEFARTFFVASALIALGGLAAFGNPLFTNYPIAGGAAINTLLVAYALPGLLTLALARLEHALSSRAIGATANVAIILWFFAFATLETRRVFQGATIGIERGAGNGEWYAYSAVWLALGLLLLGYGVWRGLREARWASAFFIFATTLKVFLFDLAGLEGVLRALSFLGLGAALIGIGLVYQKWVFARPTAGADPETA
jgi:uncharacterized membrane protein